MKSNLPVRLLSKLFSALAILSPLPSFAELPKGNSFISVGTFNQGTNLEASYYIDKTSIQKKEISFITLNGSCRNTNSQIILILVNANTSTQKLKKWLIAKIGKEGQFTFSALDRNGVVLISGGSAVNMEIPQPDSIGFKAMDIMCKGK